MRVTGLFVYPVKSCRGIALERADVEVRGLRHDRRWMIVDDDGRFVTQREVPTLARVEVTVDGEALTLSTDGQPGVRVPVDPDPGWPLETVTVWQSQVDALDCGDEVARWLGARIGSPARLVTMPPEAKRAIEPEHARPGDLVSFADGYPLLLTATASLEDLNARLAWPVPMDRFRPNVVVDGGAPWLEDSWTRVRLGSVDFRVAKPCARCVITTTDQRTGERGVEPLRTLATFRQVGRSVLFGQNLIPDTTGTLSIGDEVVVVS